MFLNEKEFLDIEKHLELQDKKREEVISESRIIIKLSKEIIYALHRHDIASAKKAVVEITKNVKNLPDHASTNMSSVARQEYVEALGFFHFVADKRIPTRKELGVDATDYLLGLCDLTGEVMRRGVNSVINKNYKEAMHCRDLVEEIYDQFMKFDLPNSELRKKSDAIKWNLRKLEDVAYDIKLKLEK
ncbi:hypothetical protein J4457_02655 [Candidatus Woesearchaeota archaeon]|nr:hypothetical protein [Candidatus Woesearchaeota archaeon]